MSNVNERHCCDVAVVGAGAAGLAAAIAAAERAKIPGALQIVLLDGAKTIGAKILVSGGGRCNVTHHKVTPEDFFGNRRIIKNVLAAFTVHDTINWFTSMGVPLKREDTGKLFPVTDEARTVLTALLDRCRALGIDLRLGHRVTDIVHAREHVFTIHHAQGMLQAKNVVLATGGGSLPKSGSDGFGYALARRLGHHVTPTVPALAPLVLHDAMFHKSLSGLSHEVELITMVNGRKVDRRAGNLLWTHFGISGPVVMDASRFWTLARHRGEAAELSGNFFPGQTQEQVRTWYLEVASRNPRRSLGRTLALRLPDRFAEALCRYVRCDPQQAIAQVCRADRNRMITSLTKFVFPVERDRGWNYAEVTAGGIPLEEVSFRTMESKQVPGLYVVGEILDCDGRIGGFNFQWAWATGWLAGQAVGEAWSGEHTRSDHSLPQATSHSA